MGPKCYFKVNAPISLSENGKSVTVYPADEFRITCTIAYDHPLIGTQTCDFVIDRETFEKRSVRPGRSVFFMRWK